MSLWISFHMIGLTIRLPWVCALLTAYKLEASRSYANLTDLGAFAFFGPGSFSTLYTSLTLPAANGRLHFAGEALSTRHAWVVGALNSAWRTINEILNGPSPWSTPEKLKEFYKKWGVDEEWINGHTPYTSPDHEGEPQLPDLLYKFLVLHRPELYE